ncbi:MAG: molybdopterin-dependent oxidoreductase [Candidatus Thorarchaeota archaeon]|nr:molybdopterin-dependent oxidoreductase [Candidatus Thorarchaeota archaeon]
MTRQKFVTVCPRDCYDTCSLEVVTENGSIESMRGYSDSPLTCGITCPRASKDAERLNKNRVLHPYKLISDTGKQRKKRVTWGYALDEIANRLHRVLNEHGPETVLLLDYLGNTGLLTWHFPRRLWNALGATRTDYSLCAKSGNDAISQHYGKSYGLLPKYLLKSDLHVYWGFNAAVSAPHFWNLSRIAREDKDTRIIVIDPRRSKSAKQSDLWLRPKPGSDLALAYGIANQLIAKDYIDYPFLDKWANGYEHFETQAARWDLESTAEATGVPYQTITEMATAYGRADRSALLLGVGFQKARQGGKAVGVVSLLPALVGLHRGFFYSNGSGFDVDTAYLEGITLADTNPRIVSQVDLGKHVEDGEFKFIFCYNMNPALTVPDQTAFRSGLERSDVFLVVHETHWTETTDYADLVLPAPTYLEKRDIVVPWAHNRVRESPRIVEPQGQSKTEIWLMQEIAKTLEIEEDWVRADPWKCLAAATSTAFDDGTIEDLIAGKTLHLSYRSMASYTTKSGKIEFGTSLPEYEPIAHSTNHLVLLNSALPQYTHTQFQEVYGPIPSVVHIHPLDARERGIKQDDIIIISNSQGHVLLQANPSTDIQRGTIWTPREGKGLGGTPLNALTSGTPQKLGGGPMFNSTLVSVELYEKC